MNTVWTFRFLGSWEDVENPAFLEQWHNAYTSAASACIFNHPVLSGIWTDTYRPKNNIAPLFCIAEKTNGRILMPLVIWKRNIKNLFQKVIVPVGFADYDYHNPLVTGDVTQEELVAFHQELYRHLNKFKFDTIYINGLSLVSDQDLSICLPEETCRYITIKDFRSVDDYLATLSRKTVHELRRRKKRILEQHTLDYVVFSRDDLKEAREELEQLLHHNALRWPKAYKAPGFHEKLLERGLEAGLLHFSVLKLDNASASWRMGFIDGKTFYSYIPAVNYSYRQLGLGNIHLVNCIEWAIQNRFSVYDSMRGSETYKNDWYSESLSLYEIRCKKMTPMSTTRNVFSETVKPVLLFFIDNVMSILQ